MSIKDRKMKKWHGFMMPEHIQKLKEMSIDINRIQKPMLDDYQIQEMEEKIKYANEFKLPLEFSIYEQGFIKIIQGRIYKIDQIKNSIKLKLNDEQFEYVRFNEILSVKLID